MISGEEVVVMMLVSSLSLCPPDDADPTYFNYVLDVDLKGSVFMSVISLSIVQLACYSAGTSRAPLMDRRLLLRLESLDKVTV
jgi:hypothetical protein